MLHALAAQRSDATVWWLHTARDRADHALAGEAHDLLAALARRARAHLLHRRHPDGSRPRTHGPPDRRRSPTSACPPTRPPTSADPPRSWPTCTTRSPARPGRRPHPHRAVRRDARHQPRRDRPRPYTAAPAARPAGHRAGDHLRPQRPHRALVDDRQPAVLELADACDVPTRWSCRTGVCHTCSTPLSGEVTTRPDRSNRPARRRPDLLRPPPPTSSSTSERGSPRPRDSPARPADPRPLPRRRGRRGRLALADPRAARQRGQRRALGADQDRDAGARRQEVAGRPAQRPVGRLHRARRRPTAAPWPAPTATCRGARATPTRSPCSPTSTQITGYLRRHVAPAGRRSPSPTSATRQPGSTTSARTATARSTRWSATTSPTWSPPSASCRRPRRRFATKYVNRDLLDLDPQGRTRIRFSLMPDARRAGCSTSAPARSPSGSPRSTTSSRPATRCTSTSRRSCCATAGRRDWAALLDAARRRARPGAPRRRPPPRSSC